MEIQEMKKKSDEELKKLLMQYEGDLRNMRFQIANSQLKAVRKVREMRKDIARIHLILTQRKQTTSS